VTIQQNTLRNEAVGPVQRRHIAYVDGHVLDVHCEGNILEIGQPDTHGQQLWLIHARQSRLFVERHGVVSGHMEAEWTEVEWLAALDAAFALHPDIPEIELVAGQAPGTILDALALPANATPCVSRQLLWQTPRLWLALPRTPMGLLYTLSDGYRHPIRPRKPQGTVYQRHIPWLDMELRFRTVDPEADLTIMHRWMNDPVVSHFWGEQGDPPHQRAYLERNAADPHNIGLIGEFDGMPFGYFEAYWAREDRIAPFYDADDYDRGWHALVGEPAFRGRDYLTAWLPSLSHYLFLDDSRTGNIVVEPRVDNQKMRKNLARCGYALLKEIEFPHKRALLAMLSRERFFSEAVLIPQSGATAPEAIS